jgi:hypothetical protein
MRFWCCVVWGCLAAGNLAWGLEAGVGAADITPDVQAFRVPMAGYGARMGRPAAGVHDPLHAKILFLREGAAQMTLITCDLRSITPEFKNQVVEKSSALGFTADNVFMAASHTHDGPSMYPERFWQLQFGAYDPKIVEAMSTAVAAALKEAVRTAAPAKLGFGEGRAEGFTRNRRWGYDTAAREAAGEKPAVEPLVWVLRVDSMEGDVRAVLVNFASHPTILPAKNMLLSAEWPGVLQQEIEKAFPRAVALFTNGAQGDQSPQDAQGADDFERMTDYGRRFAGIAAEVARGIETRADVGIGFKRGRPELPELQFPESAGKKFAAYLDAAREGLPRTAEIQVFRIGSTALVGLPGEPILAVGQAVGASVVEQGFERAVVIGLANDYIGYLVNETEYAHGGYEVESRSYYGPGLGTFLAEQAGKIAGELRPR